MKKKLMVSILFLTVVLFFIAFAIFQKTKKKNNAPQHQNRQARVQVKEVTKPRVLLKGAQITYWKTMTDSHLWNDVFVTPTPPKPDLSEVPREIKTLYAKKYIYIEKVRLESGREFNIVYPRPFLNVQEYAKREIEYKEKVQIFSKKWKLIHTIIPKRV